MKKNYLVYFFVFLFVGASYAFYNLVNSPTPHQDIDSKAYIENATLFSKNTSFSQRTDFPYYTLGYPLILGLLYKLCGYDYFWVVIFQLFLVLISGLLIALIAQRLFDQRAGLVAFVLTLLNLGYLVFAQFILTEIVLSFFLLLFFERFTAYVQTKKMNALWSAGVLLGLSVIIKPAAIYFPILLVPMMRFKSWSFFLICFLVPIVGYMVHNKIVFNHFKLSALDEINVVYWWYPNVLAQQRGTTSDHERMKLQKIAHDKGEVFVRAAFKKDLYAHPMLFLTVWLANVGKTFLGLYTSNLKVLIGKINNYDISFFRKKGTWLQKIHRYVSGGTTHAWVAAVGYLECGFQVIRYLLCLLACIVLTARRRWHVLYLFCVYLFYFSMITGHDGCARFRMMFESVLIILTAYALVWLFCAERMSFRKGEEHD